MGEHFFRSALHEDAPLREHHKTVGDAGHVIHAVADEDHRGTGFLPIFTDVLQDLLASTGIQPGSGFVQNQDRGPHGDDTGDGNTPFLTAGQLQRRFLKQFLFHSNERSCLPDPLIDLLFGEFHVGRSEGNILVNSLLKELILGILEYQPHAEPHIVGELF